MPAQATAFTTPPIPARATAFITPSLARATAFVTPAIPPVPTDVTVQFAPDCGYVQITVARDLSGASDLQAAVYDLSGQVLASSIIGISEVATIIRFNPAKDGMYMLHLTSDGGLVLLAPVLAYCRALGCLRDLNRPVATGGRNGQATAPDDKWKNVYARIWLAIACCDTADYVTAQKMIESLTDYCTECGCGC